MLMGQRPWGREGRRLLILGVGLSCEGNEGEVGKKEGREGATPNTLQLDLYTA